MRLVKLLHDVNEVCRLIDEEKQIVAIFQGESEWGPRALGNRSILFDPRNPNAKNIVNVIKKREFYRPFAGSILEEYAHDWFEMGTLDSSPYMSFAIQAKEIASLLAEFRNYSLPAGFLCSLTHSLGLLVEEA